MPWVPLAASPVVPQSNALHILWYIDSSHWQHALNFQGSVFQLKHHRQVSTKTLWHYWSIQFLFSWWKYTCLRKPSQNTAYIKVFVSLTCHNVHLTQNTYLLDKTCWYIYSMLSVHNVNSWILGDKSWGDDVLYILVTLDFLDENWNSKDSLKLTLQYVIRMFCFYKKQRSYPPWTWLFHWEWHSMWQGVGINSLVFSICQSWYVLYLEIQIVSISFIFGTHMHVFLLKKKTWKLGLSDS